MTTRNSSTGKNLASGWIEPSDGLHEFSTGNREELVVDVDLYEAGVYRNGLIRVGQAGDRRGQTRRGKLHGKNAVVDVRIRWKHQSVAAERSAVA